MSEIEKERKRKNKIVFGLIAGFVTLIFLITIVRMQGL